MHPQHATTNKQNDQQTKVCLQIKFKGNKFSKKKNKHYETKHLKSVFMFHLAFNVASCN